MTAFLMDLWGMLKPYVVPAFMFLLPYLSSLVPALIISGLLTQVLKYPYRVWKGWGGIVTPSGIERLGFQTFASLVCLVALLWTWPRPIGAVDVAWCMALSMLSPVTYKVTMAMLYRRFPVLESVFSAARPIEWKRNEKGEVIGFKEGPTDDDPDPKTQPIRKRGES